MAELIDRMELSNAQRAELDDEGVTWLVQAAGPGVQAAQTIRLDAAAATRLLDFLLLYQEQLVRWRDGFTPKNFRLRRWGTLLNDQPIALLES